MKLTNQLRDKIISEVVEITTGKQKIALEKRSQALALQLYNHLYSKATRDAMAKLPRGFLPEDKCLRFNLGGMNISISTAEFVRVPYRDWKDTPGMSAKSSKGRYRMDTLPRQIYATLSADGTALKGRLSKEFLCWIMGYPITWCEYAPRVSEIQSIHGLQQNLLFPVEDI